MNVGKLARTTGYRADRRPLQQPTPGLDRASRDESAKASLPNGRLIPRADYHPDAIKLLELARIFEQPHLVDHIPRYLHAIRHMPHREHLRSGQYDSALEIGTTFFFPLVLRDMFKFERV